MNFPGLRRTSPRVAAEHLDGDNWRLLRDYSVAWDEKPWALVAATGFVTDFSSVPQIVRSFIPQRGNQDGPAVMHDLCYRLGLLGRAAADKLYLKLMKLEGIRWSKRWALYLGVRAGGWVSWNNHRDKRAQDNGR